MYSDEKKELEKAQVLLQGDDVCKQTFRNLPIATALHAAIDAKLSQKCAFDGIRRTIQILESDVKKPPLANLEQANSAVVLVGALRKLSEGIAQIQISNQGQ